MASPYGDCIDTLVKVLKATTSILKRGEEYAKANNIPETDLIAKRIYEDMYPLTIQVGYVVTLTRLAVEKLTGTSVPESESSLHRPQGEKRTLQDMFASIDDVRQELEAIDKGSFGGKVQQEIVFNMGPETLKKGTTADFIRGMVLPNIYFHLCMTYAILRQQGVPVGKRDYLSDFVSDFADA